MEVIPLAIKATVQALKNGVAQDLTGEGVFEDSAWFTNQDTADAYLVEHRLMATLLGIDLGVTFEEGEPTDGSEIHSL